MKQLPVASAMGSIHSGTMAGKLNGVIPATTPSGCRNDQLSIPVPTCSVNSPFKQVRNAGGKLDDLQAARHFTSGVVENLAVLGGDDRGEPVGILLEQVAKTKQHPRAP